MELKANSINVTLDGEHNYLSLVTAISAHSESDHTAEN